mgnify:CR=1 FL=1
MYLYVTVAFEITILFIQVAFLKDALVKKDAELERYQRENRLKGNENSLDRSKKGGFPLEVGHFNVLF